MIITIRLNDYRNRPLELSEGQTMASLGRIIADAITSEAVQSKLETNIKVAAVNICGQDK